MKDTLLSGMREHGHHAGLRGCFYATVLILGAGLVGGCDKDEAPPPLPSAQPKPAETTAQLNLEVEEIDAGAPEKPKTGKGGPSTNLKNCCAALMQNAASAPEPTATYMKQAAATCSAMVASGQAAGAIQGAIRLALQGANMPAGCR